MPSWLRPDIGPIHRNAAQPDLALHGGPMAYHGPSGLAHRPGSVRQCRARGIRGAALGFNPNPPRPLLSCALQLLLEISTDSPPHRFLCLDAPHRLSAPALLPSSPLQHRPTPFPHGYQGQ
jgi:hypothetical protein